MEINEFARMSKDRAVKNDPDSRFDWKYYVVALAGESGEISNQLKKILRGDHELDTNELAEEVADAITYGLLLLSTLGVDPEKALLDKYEKVDSRIAAGGFGARPTELKNFEQVHGHPVLIRIQRDGESLSDAAKLLAQAGKAKQAGKMILISTNKCSPIQQLPQNVTVIDSLAYVLSRL